MALPISRNQLKQLTRRLHDGKETPDDLHTLADVLVYYHEVLARAQDDVERLCAGMPNAEPMAPRVKTLKTMLEKLHRQDHLQSIAQIRDLAGLRVVVNGSRTDQSSVVARIAALFPDPDRPPKIIDRRSEPKAGYRAVHLEVRRDSILIEVQVRTALQHRWAELYERAGDRLGRGIRYGEPVELVSQAERLVRLLSWLSDQINGHELTAVALETNPSGDGDLDRYVHQIGETTLREQLAAVTEMLEQLR
jgi:ppGpp synthetase/RelA/SpoT-type nucleotidyltranferase